MKKLLSLALATAIALFSGSVAEADNLKEITATVDNHSFKLGRGLQILVPGHTDWIFTTQRKGQFVSEGWYKDGKLVHAMIFNIGNDSFNPMLYIDGTAAITLSKQSGYGWTDQEWLESQATVATNPWDDKYDTWDDPNITKETGSANMSFYSPAELLAEKYGVSPAVLRFYDRYAQKQVKRPRWWLNIFGLPVGMYNPTATLPGFSEWWENSQGLNAYDVQHFDGYELYSAYKFTKDPFYLFSLMNLWYHAELNSWYLQHDPNQSYGSERILGWYLVLSSQLYEITHNLEGFEGVAERVKQSIVWHVKNGIEKFPIASPWFSGSIPIEFKIAKKDYVFGWQYAVIIHGYLAVAETFAESDLDLSTRAKEHAHKAMEYIVAHCDDKPATTDGAWIGYIWAVDETPSLLFKSAPPGVCDWYLAPLMKFDAIEFPVKDSLIKRLIESGWTKESHKNFVYALNVMGEEVWNL